MKITLFGSTGDLGRECLLQSLEAGHEVTVLVRSPEKLSQALASKITVVKGDALLIEDVMRSISKNTEAILFAIGVDEKTSPRDLCTNATENIIRVMRSNNVSRLIWCGGGSNILKDDVISFGSKFVRWYAEVFLKHRHTDKEHQISLLEDSDDLDWIGVRPLQMKQGIKRGKYRLGYYSYSGFSKITFADCAHAMVNMLGDDTWVRKAPIIQY
tara:strand:+ start:400 stop:1041 length:642 start_codon:yes stop_codon:yes gene_type:complete